LPSILVKHATIIALEANGRIPEIIEDGALLTDSDKIVALGKTDEVSKQYKATDIVIDGSHRIVIPGIVDAHTHIAASFLRGLLEDVEDHFYGFALPLEDFLTESMTRKFSLLGAIEAAKFGITCINDIYHYASATASAVDKVGLRAVVANKVFDAELSKIGKGLYIRDPRKGKERLESNVRLVKEWKGKRDSTVTCRIGTHATDTCSRELLRAAKQEASRLGVGMHIHVAQSEREVSYIKSEYGKSPVEYLDSLGFLDQNVIAAHLIFASEQDFRIMRERGASVAHCPSVYGKVCVFPRVDEMYSSGVSLGLGTDWLSMDIWDNLRQAIGIARILSGRLIVTARRALRLATIESARALQLDGIIGSLSVGKRADFAIVNVKKAHLMPWRNPIQNLVYYANGGDIETVVVNGRIIVKGGLMQTVNEDQAIRDAQESAEQLWSNLPYPAPLK